MLLQLAVQETISVYWTQVILEEWLRNVEPNLRARLEARTLPLMRHHFPLATVEAVDNGRDLGRTHATDRHVALGALGVSPSALVTWNVRDFDCDWLAKQGVQVCTPDAFLASRFEREPELVYGIVKAAQANLSKSCPDWDKYLNLLEDKNRLLQFVNKMKSFESGAVRGS